MNLLRIAAAVILTTAVTASTTESARATGRYAHAHLRVELLARFDQAANQPAEGLARTPDGSLYVSFKPLQQVVQVHPDGSHTVVATLPGHATGMGGLVGLTATPDGRILGALANGDPRYNGIWAVRPGGKAHRLAALPADAVPNDLVLAPDGQSVLVSESGGGTIYRISLSDGRMTTWLHDPLLQPPIGAAIPIGVNGITFRSPTELVAVNSAAGSVISVPIRRDGSAGTPGKIGEADFPDGVRALRGRLYITQPVDNRVIRISPSGRTTVLANGEAGLDAPVSILLGRHRRGVTEVIVTDSSVTDTGDRPGVTSLTLR
ncbi:SMP-30/gluconolactonase/LRE family protein [Streptomyces sp. NPDC088747]|uniref:SMP-30/gluconolactonase/LRE family protein n=1 Tax=Streptomyces sp. NPDC088747 TaxID=3365886 RepID=UPI003825D573